MNLTLLNNEQKKDISIEEILELINLNTEQETDLDHGIEILLGRKKSKNISFKKIPNNSNIIPKSGIFDVLDISYSEMEIAQQLTIITHSRMSRIKKKEFLNKNWERSNKKIESPNIVGIFERFNQLTNWISEEILRYDRKRHRKLAIEKFVNIAEECWKINNFNDCFNIVLCLTTSPSLRHLKKTWVRVSIDIKNKLEVLDNYFLQDGNYAQLRKMMENAKGSPCVPYFGYFTRELSYISESKYIENGCLLNCEKLRKTGEFIDLFHELVNKNVYPYKENTKLNFLLNLKPLSEDELIELSHKLGNYFFNLY